MAEPLVTIVVVPRERFSFSRQSLASIVEHISQSFRLVYVDGNSPPHVRANLAAEASRHGFEVLRTDRYLSPNQARNLGLARVSTKYVVFIDNDVLVTEGWLERLVSCAEETGAWIVGPICLIGSPQAQVIHIAGGKWRSAT